MTPRLGFLFVLFVFVAGAGAGYLVLTAQPSADQVNPPADQATGTGICAAPPANPSAASAPTAADQNSLGLHLFLAQDFFQPNDPVRFALGNYGLTAIAIPTGFPFRITNQRTGQTVVEPKPLAVDISDPPIAVDQLVLAPNKLVPFCWDQIGTTGQPVPAGAYRVEYVGLGNDRAYEYFEIGRITLAIAPQSGPAPLTIAFTVSFDPALSPPGALEYYPGDESAGISIDFPENNPNWRGMFRGTHTYETPGAYQFRLSTMGVSFSQTVQAGPRKLAPPPPAPPAKGAVAPPCGTQLPPLKIDQLTRATTPTELKRLFDQLTKEINAESTRIMAQTEQDRAAALAGATSNVAQVRAARAVYQSCLAAAAERKRNSTRALLQAYQARLRALR